MSECLYQARLALVGYNPGAERSPTLHMCFLGVKGNDLDATKPLPELIDCRLPKAWSLDVAVIPWTEEAER